MIHHTPPKPILLAAACICLMTSLAAQPTVGSVPGALGAVLTPLSQPNNIYRSDFHGTVSVNVGDNFDNGKILNAVGRESNDRIGFLYPFPASSLTVDIGVVSEINDIKNNLGVILIKRNAEPFKGWWALPGGFVDIFKGEEIDQAAVRELREETSVHVDETQLHQIHAVANRTRDPRAFTTTVLYGAQVAFDKVNLKASDDACDARWFELDMDMFEKAQCKDEECVIPANRIITKEMLNGKKIPLAFDHLELLRLLSEDMSK